MRVGIVTLPLYNNYGGILQNYALQQVLIRLGHKPITINKERQYNKVRYYLSILKFNVFKTFGYHRDKYFYYQGFRREPEIKKFIKKRIRLTNAVTQYSKNCIKRNKCEAIVVGSDQVWRRSFWNEIELLDYFLQFLEGIEIKRIAIAASFGIDDWDYEDIITQSCSNLLAKFDKVSTREDSGVELCKKFLHRNDVVGILDPTMMLNVNDYLDICNNVSFRGYGILFAYILDYDADKIELISKVALQKGLRPIIKYSEQKAELSVEEWLAHFRDAEYIITDSFHGTVFSIIFNKPFNAIINSVRGSGRFHSLLNRFDLRDRIVSESDNINTNDIDWNPVKEKLSALKEKTYFFIKNAFK